jgi:hypothetical protein
MNKYVEHIINDLVRDTIINYDKKRIYSPYIGPPSHSYSFGFFFSYPPYLDVSNYCRNKYGLTKDEIKYVWKEYKSIIKDKFINNEI